MDGLIVKLDFFQQAYKLDMDFRGHNSSPISRLSCWETVSQEKIFPLCKILGKAAEFSWSELIDGLDCCGIVLESHSIGHIQSPAFITWRCQFVNYQRHVDNNIFLT